MATITKRETPGCWVVTYDTEDVGCVTGFVLEADANQYIEVVSAQPHPRNEFEVIQIMEMGKRLAGGRN